jgi:myo-inositol 2-dehydrogenase/D-chiro-inositol 1-dehydrogenase
MEFLLTGGDVFHDLATHDIDFILSLMDGELPSEVYARGASMEPMLKAAGVMDTATVVLGFPSGLNVSMELSRNASYGYDQRMEVFGSKGNMCAVENSHKVPMVAANSAGIHRSGLSYSFPDRFREAYELELDLFADIIEGKDTPRVTSHDAVMASRVAEAALQSAQQGIPIKLDAPNLEEAAR